MSESCLKLFSEFGFKNVHILSAGLEASEAVYIRTNTAPGGLDIPKYGFKSGPNKHFLFNLNKLKSLGYKAVLQCETDMFPLKPDWVGAIFNSADFTKVVSGPIYRGPTALGGNVFLHVNGNAIYNLSHPKFEAWIDFLESCILYLVSQHGITGTAFDTSFFEVICLYIKNGWNSTIAKIKSDFVKNEDDLRAFLDLYHYNSKILNFSGSIEASSDYVIDFEMILSEFGNNPFLIHSPHFRYYIAAKILEKNKCLDWKRLVNYFTNKLFPILERENNILKYVKSSDYISKVFIGSYLSPFAWRF